MELGFVGSPTPCASVALVREFASKSTARVPELIMEKMLSPPIGFRCAREFVLTPNQVRFRVDLVGRLSPIDLPVESVERHTNRAHTVSK